MSCEQHMKWIEPVCFGMCGLTLIFLEIVLVLELIKNNQSVGYIVLYVIIIKLITLIEVGYI